jgi:DnaJ like chaperone protein
MIAGKLVAGLLGLLTGGPIGAGIGVAVGHFFDRGLGRAMAFASPENLKRVKHSFFETSFLLLGYLAKADGRITEQEIAYTEAIFKQMQLDASQRQEAIALFKRGAQADFDMASAIAKFNETTAGNRLLARTLLTLLLSLALADHALDDEERRALQIIAGQLGVSHAELEQLIRMAQAQEHFHHDEPGGSRGASAADQLSDAYAALGVSQAANDAELKRAYRKLMSEHHPDKLIARGVPEDMVKLATARAQDIQKAYEVIKRAREPR